MLGLALASALPGCVGGREADTFFAVTVGEQDHAPHLAFVDFAIARDGLDHPQLVQLGVVEKDVGHRVTEPTADRVAKSLTIPSVRVPRRTVHVDDFETRESRRVLVDAALIVRVTRRFGAVFFSLPRLNTSRAALPQSAVAKRAFQSASGLRS